MAKMKIALKDRPRVKLECYRMLSRLKLDPARATIISVFIESYLNLTASEAKRYENELSQLSLEEKETTMELMTIWERKGLEQGLTQGLEQGLTQGLEQGLTQGLEQGLTQGREATLLRQIRKRFGIITEDVATRLDKLSLENLDELAKALLDFNSVADLNEWFMRRS